MAQIQIWTRDVDGLNLLLGTKPQHTFLIKINDDGTREILRGGPINDNMIMDDIQIVKAPYDGPNNGPNNPTPDFFDPSLPNTLNYQGTTVKTATQAEIDALWNNAWSTAQNINAQNYDYEAFTQNCNTTTALLANVMGVKDQVASFLANQAHVWTPGLDLGFESSIVDKIGNLIIHPTAEFDKIIDFVKGNPILDFELGKVEDFYGAVKTFFLSPLGIDKAHADPFQVSLGTNGNDIFLTSQGRHLIIGSEGSDTADYSSALIAIDADIGSNSVIVGYSTAPDGSIANQDILYSVENITGSNYGDTIFGDNRNNILNGNGGNDELDGGSGSDTYIFNGSFGRDTIIDDGLGNGSGNKDIININGTILSGEATFEKEETNGNLTYRLGSLLITKSPTSTTLTISSGSADSITINNFTNGDFGITLEDKPDDEDPEKPEDQNPFDPNDPNALIGTDGNDNIAGTAAGDKIFGGAGDDTIHGGAGGDQIYGGSGNDIISGGTGDDYLNGGSGNDSLFGDEGNDFLDGGSGDDGLLGGAGNDVIFGGSGSDQLRSCAEIIYPINRRLASIF